MKERSVVALIVMATLVVTSAGIGTILVTSRPILLIQTTTDLNDSGLLDAIKPVFDAEYHANMEWVSVGTGQALANAALGEADVVIVHSPTSEIAFVNHTNPAQTDAKLAINYAGQGIMRINIASNYYVIVGPTNDPLGILNSAIMGNATAIFQKIYANRYNATTGTGIYFVSRGDASGTNAKEVSIWKSLGLWDSTGASSTYLGWPKNTPKSGDIWYLSTGQGQAATLQIANQKLAYALTDYSTWLNIRSTLTNLEVVSAKNCTLLKNIYSVIAVDPQLHPNVDFELAKKFIYFTAREGENIIGNYTIGGQQAYCRCLNYTGTSPSGSPLDDVYNGTFGSNLGNPHYNPVAPPQQACDQSYESSSSMPRRLSN